MIHQTDRAAEVDGPALLTALDAGRMLPSRWYTDREIFEQEQKRILRRSWAYAAHTGQLAGPGDVALCEVGGVPIALTRDDEGEIRGFVNICRHRAHPVVLEPGNRSRRTVQCLYHGWTYRFDGSLASAPRAEFEGLDFDPEQCGLIPVQTHVWGPTVWVNPSPDAPPFTEWVKGLAEEVARNGVDVDNQVFAFEREFVLRANWKVFLDNAIECYHCPTCHTQLSRVLDMNPKRHSNWIGGRYWSTNRIPFRNEHRQYYHTWIFPTTYFQYAGAGFDIGAMEIKDTNHLIFRSVNFVPAGTPDDEIAALEKRLDESPTIREDVDICERVQRAHEADAAPPGRLMPRSEERVLYFQRIIIEMMMGRG